MFVNLDPNKEEKKIVLNLDVELSLLLIFPIVNVFLIPYPHYIKERFACHRVPWAQSQTNIPMKEQESIIKI